MIEPAMIFVSLASFVLSAVSLLVTVASYKKLSDESAETFAEIGADEGNHEARLERLETKAGLQIISSPSALDVLLDEGLPATELEAAFADEHENTELQASVDTLEDGRSMAHGD